MLDKIAEKIKTAGKIAVFSHMRPDGDTLGSALGLMWTVRAAYDGRKTLDVYCDSAISEYYDVVPGMREVIVSGDLKQNYDLMIAVDCADLARLGSYADAFKKHRVSINIDHHHTNDGFAVFNHIRPKASSTCEVIFPLLEKLGGGAFRAEAATCVYIGLSTDTGNFTHSNTTSATHITAAKLLDAGVPVAEINYKLYKEESFARMQLLARALSGLKLYSDGKIAGMYISMEMLQETGCRSYDTEGFVDYTVNIAGAEIGFLLQEIGRNSFKISLRSKGAADVSRVAAAFSGGGHKQAAGGMVKGEYYGAIERIIRVCELEF